MPAIRHLLAFVLIAFGAVWPLSPAVAAINTPQTTGNSAAATTQVQNSYRVEMIFFTFNSPGNFTQEDWRQGLPAPDLTHAINLFGGQPVPTGFKVLPPSAYELDAVAKRLQDSGRYTVIDHVAWQQPGLAINQAIPVIINAGADYGPLYPQLMQPSFVTSNGQTQEIPAPQHLYQLHGTVTIVLSRYLHLYTDLVLRVPTVAQSVPASTLLGQVGQPPQLPAATTTAQTQANSVPPMQTQLVEDVPVISNPSSAQPAPGGALTSVHIIEHRHTRSRKLNYVDHPLLGILFEIWPIGNSR